MFQNREGQRVPQVFVERYQGTRPSGLLPFKKS
jgi:hypothetical protein